jgi:hypothetical protein
VLPTLVRPARRTLERGWQSPRKGDGRLSRARLGRCRVVGPVRRVSSITISPVRPSPLPHCHHWHYSAIPSAVGVRGDKTPPRTATTPAALRPPAFCQPDPRDDARTTTREEAPTPPPSKPLLDGYRERHDALPETRFARTAINSITLHTIPLHVIRTVRHDCKPPPLGL